jgi:hypothetical protein
VDNLVFSRDAEARGSADAQAEPVWLMPAELSEPFGERLVQTVSRWAGVTAFIAATGVVGWLIIG